MKNISFMLLAFGLVVIVSPFSVGLTDGLFLEGQDNENRFLPGVFLAGAMLLGILAGRIHSLIEQDGDFHVKALRDRLLTDRELWKSLVASPIVFGVVYTALSEANDAVVSLIFSFQNGFFCNVIMSRKKLEIENEK